MQQITHLPNILDIGLKSRLPCSQFDLILYQQSFVQLDSLLHLDILLLTSKERLFFFQQLSKCTTHHKLVDQRRLLELPSQPLLDIESFGPSVSSQKFREHEQTEIVFYDQFAYLFQTLFDFFC